MQFLRNDEVIAEEKYKSITKDLIMLERDPKISFDMNQFIISTFAYIYKDIQHLIDEINKCLTYIEIENINYTYLSLFKIILQNYLDRKGNTEEIKKSLKKKNIDDLDLSKEDEFLKVPQNLLFNYQGLLQKKLIKSISFIDYLKYLDIIDRNEE